jgi:NTP pyrophosphatase (non-canonical NTP hydrolase)
MGFLQDLRVKNLCRCEESFPHRAYPGLAPSGLHAWTPLEWAGALAGEVGELANLLKKDRRGEEVDWQQVKKEIADAFIYLDLCAAACGVELEQAVREKFNEVSERVHSPHRL